MAEKIYTYEEIVMARVVMALIALDSKTQIEMRVNPLPLSLIVNNCKDLTAGDVALGCRLAKDKGLVGGHLEEGSGAFYHSWVKPIQDCPDLARIARVELSKNPQLDRIEAMLNDVLTILKGDQPCPPQE